MVSVQLATIKRFHLPASLRSTSVTSLHRYYGCSDSCLRPSRQTGIPASFVETSDHSASNHPLPSRRLGSIFPSSLPRVTAPRAGRTPLFPGRSVIWASPLASRLTTTAGRIEFAVARKPSRYCGLIVHLRLLSTPPHGDAVTFGYKVQSRPWQGLAPCRFNNITGALAAFARTRVSRTLASAATQILSVDKALGSLSRRGRLIVVQRFIAGNVRSKFK